MKFKIAFGYLVFMILILLASIIAYKSLSAIIQSIDTLSKPKQNSDLVKNIINGISEIRSNTRFYSITLDSTYYKNYINDNKAVKNLIDSLTTTEYKDQNKNSLLNLKNSYNEYIYSLDKWLKFKTKTQVNDYENLIKNLEKNTESLELNKQNLPHSKIKTTKQIIEKSILAKKYTIEEIEKKKGFLERILGKKNDTKKETKIINLPNDTLKKELLTEIKTEILVDSNYYKKVDLILEQMQEMIIEQNFKKKIRKNKLEQMEKKLIEDQDILVNKINDILQHVNNQNKIETQLKINESKLAAEKGYKNLTILGFISLFVSILFTVILFNDISKSNYYKKQLEISKNKALKLAQVKENFLSNMSHELRSPLTNIIGFIEILSKNPTINNNKKYIQLLSKSSNHLLSIVNDILDYSKLESGKINFEFIGFKPNDLIFEVVNQMKFKADNKQLNISILNKTDKNLILFSDPFRIKQVLINMIDNSIKFTNKGFINIELSQNNEFYTFTIIDSGIGIDKKNSKKIFQNFNQATDEISQQYGGTGLGLAISKKIIDQLNGTIQFESVLNEGSKFMIQIPFQIAQIDEYFTEKEHFTEINNEFENKKILVIDDDKMVHEVLKPIFNTWKINSIFTSNSIEAQNYLNETIFDVILLDYRLKNENALELISIIKLSKNQQTPIIVCTANVRLDKSAIMNKLNGGNILFKPFKQFELCEILGKTLKINTIQYFTKHEKYQNLKQYSLDEFNSFAQNDKETLQIFIKSFIEQSGMELEEIELCIKNKNYKQIIEIAHRMINTCSQLNAVTITHILSKIEQLESKPIDPNEIVDLVLALKTEIIDLNKLLEKEI